MKFKVSILNIALGLAVLFIANAWSSERKYSKQNTRNLSLMQDSVAIHKKAYLITDRTLKELKNENEQLKEDLKDFKSVTSITTITSVTKIDTIYVPFNDSIDCNFSTSIDIDSTFYKISATISNEGMALTRIEVPNRMSIIVGDKKIKGWMGVTTGKEYSIIVNNTNPYIQTQNTHNYTIVKRDKWYESPYFLVGAGFIGGVLIAK